MLRACRSWLSGALSSLTRELSIAERKGSRSPRQRRVGAVGVDGTACKEFLLDAGAIAAGEQHRPRDDRLADAELQQNLCFLLVGFVDRAHRRRCVMAC